MIGIILGILTLAVSMILIIGPIIMIAAIFSGSFSIGNLDGTESEFDIQEYLQEVIPPKRSYFIDNLRTVYENNLIENGGLYHYVRLFPEGSTDADAEDPFENIESMVYPAESLISIILPVFWTRIFENDFFLNRNVVEAITSNMWETIIGYETTELPIEYCSEHCPVDDGNNPHLHSHADLLNCPNSYSGFHSDYTSICCDIEFYRCLGHKHTLWCTTLPHEHSIDCDDPCFIASHYHHEWTSASSPGCYNTLYCSSGNMPMTSPVANACTNKQYQMICSGYTYCDGHRILRIDVRMDGMYTLIAYYYLDPIEYLANLPSRTEAQEEQLEQLRENYNMFLEFLAEAQDRYGFFGDGADLSGIVWEKGSRSGNQSIIDLALSQVGQVGGQPYWSFMSFGRRVPWCACFVSWSFAAAGYSEPKFAAVQFGGIPYFVTRGLWVDRSFTNLAPGDVIFFDWNGDGHADHVGFVIGRDATHVYTVEGNSGDQVRVKSYPLNSSVIIGYGLPNY
jgi:hypothetical protein